MLSQPRHGEKSKTQIGKINIATVSFGANQGLKILLLLRLKIDWCIHKTYLNQSKQHCSNTQNRSKSKHLRENLVSKSTQNEILKHKEVIVSSTLLLCRNMRVTACKEAVNTHSDIHLHTALFDPGGSALKQLQGLGQVQVFFLSYCWFVFQQDDDTTKTWAPPR